MFRRILGISNMKSEISDLQEKYSGIDEDLDALVKSQQAIQEELEDLRKSSISEEELEARLEELQEELDAAVDQETDFSPNEKKIISVFLHSQKEWLGSGDIAEKMGKSKGTVRKYFSMLKDKVDFEEKKDGRKKLYKLPEDTEEEIIEKGKGLKVQT